MNKWGRHSVLVTVAILSLWSPPSVAQSIRMASYVPSAYNLIEFFFEPFELFAETDIPNYVFLDFGMDEWRVRPIGSRAFDSGTELGIAFRESISLGNESCERNRMSQIVDYYLSGYHVFRLQIDLFGCDYRKLSREELVNFNFEKLEDQSRFELSFGRFVFPGLAARDETVVDILFKANVDTQGISEIQIPWKRVYTKISRIGDGLEYEFGDFDGIPEGRFIFSPQITSNSYSLLIYNGDGIRVDPSVPVQIFSYLERNLREEGDFLLSSFRYFYDILMPEGSDDSHSDIGHDSNSFSISSGL